MAVVSDPIWSLTADGQECLAVLDWDDVSGLAQSLQITNQSQRTIRFTVDGPLFSRSWDITPGNLAIDLSGFNLPVMDALGFHWPDGWSHGAHTL